MGTRKNRLLVVDDEEAILYAYKKLFGAPRMGMLVDTASSMEEAAIFLGKHKYNVVLTDLRLGINDDRSGFQLIRSIKERDKSVKIILVTAYGSMEVKKLSYEVGVDYYLEKPVSTEVLKQIFRELNI